MVSKTDIIITVIVALIYLLIIPFQLAIFPMKYYSVKDVIYSGNPRKATGALASRFLFIFLICIILWLFNKRDNTAIWGVTIGSFLCTWPSIYHYRLMACIKNKYKTLYLLACIVSILFSWASSQLAMKILLPVIFENKSFFLIDNSGIQTLLTILSLAMPIGMRKIVKEDDQNNPYLISDTIAADMYLTRRKIQFEKVFFEQYRYEIEKAAEKHSIASALLTIVVQLEKINRGAWNYHFFERLAVYLVPGFLIHRNASLGLTQVSIKTAQGYFHKAPKLYLKDMLKPEISIDLCAYVLRNILDEYDVYSPSDDEPFYDLFVQRQISDNYKCSLYIASNYICGTNNVLKKYALVYAELINDEAPAFYPENG